MREWFFRSMGQYRVGLTGDGFFYAETGERFEIIGDE